MKGIAATLSRAARLSLSSLSRRSEGDREVARGRSRDREVVRDVIAKPWKSGLIRELSWLGIDVARS